VTGCAYHHVFLLANERSFDVEDIKMGAIGVEEAKMWVIFLIRGIFFKKYGSILKKNTAFF
jgi:hypothetical protein